MYYPFFKRLIDILVSAVLLIILLPMLIVIYLILLISIGNPMFFQKRVGMNKRPFTLIKFRSMNNKLDSTGKLLPNNLRITAIGRVLRKTSLDELPQLINVLKGDMSFIGPRPLFESYLPYYTVEEQIRHTVRPGISGWAQVNGRNLLNWDTKLSLDVYYVKHISFKLDLLIAAKTIINILSAKDVLVDETNQYLNEARSAAC
jgi:undecaprenyl phosphate N,N'-diacetylbacillosamine 1-phosphate transferase